MNEKIYKGSCLCGEVTYEIKGPCKIFQYCHCSRCRKFTGSAHASNLFVPPEQFKWTTGEELIGRYEHPEAKYFATNFCKQCGSSLPWAVQGGRNIVVAAGTLDDDPGIKPMWNIFWQSRACWYEGHEQLPKFDEFPRR
ncbi:MAG: GFA family protein [Proteobacteria bacterium]|nr:GFA family protein [Pseudomonadota bacterium]